MTAPVPMTAGSRIVCPHCNASLLVRANPGKEVPFANCGNCGVYIVWNGYRSHDKYICEDCKGEGVDASEKSQEETRKPFLR